MLHSVMCSCRRWLSSVGTTAEQFRVRFGRPVCLRLQAPTLLDPVDPSIHSLSTFIVSMVPSDLE